jgi:hypothetical protein
MKLKISESQGVWESRILRPTLRILTHTSKHNFSLTLKRVGIIEISVKSGKDSISTRSLVIHTMRLKESLQKSTLAFKGSETWVSPCLSSFPERLHCCYIDFQCSFLYSYYNSSRTLCIKCWDSAFRTDLYDFILRFNKISFICGYH